jgi:crotonobetainyl-CoA:carnitine CoA-transferase CaiB-like acyl-CoA transferase
MTSDGATDPVSGSSSTGVLAGVEVLDLSWGIAGPMATMLLADHGARVTKIEPPGGDPFRSQAGYRVWNRGKRSAVLNLKSDPDRDVFTSLARTADVVVESYSPGVTDRLRIDYRTLSADNDRLVYCSITPYGRGTRDAHRPGYDALVQARTGLQWEQQGWPGGAYHLTGRDAPLGEVDIPSEAVDRPAFPRPVFVASRLPSVGACYLAATGISAALYARERTGRGQWVETSLRQGAMGASAALWQRAENPDVPGYASWIYDGRAPKGLFECADGRWVYYAFPSPGFVFNAVGDDGLRAGEGTVLPRQDADRLGADLYELAVVMQLYPRLRQAFRKFPADEWVRVAAEVGVPLCHVLSPKEAFSHQPFLSDGCVVEIDDPDAGRIRGCGITYHLANSPGRVSGPAPQVGEHTPELTAKARRRQPPRSDKTPLPGQLSRGPLSGVRVLDLGIALAGPWGAQVLSDLGADVIRVNALYDDFLIGHQYICGGRGKRSIAVNLKDQRGRAVVHRLVERADVVHLNIRGNAARRLGIDYETLRAINPRLVYCHTTGYERGERSELPSNDGIGQSEAGVTWADGGCDDGGPPFWSPTAQGDIGNGYLSVVAVVQALYERERTGHGQEVHTSITYAGLLNSSYTYLGSDGEEGETHSLDADQTGLSALYRLYSTPEGWLCLAAITEPHWRALCAALRRDDLGQDPRFTSAADRRQHDEELIGELSREFEARPAAEWVSLLDIAGVPAEVSDPTWPLRMFDDPEMIERGWVTHYDHPELGRFDQHGLLWDFSGTPGRVAGRPPMLGEHSTEILTEAGFSSAEISSLIVDDVIRQWQPVP